MDHIYPTEEHPEFWLSLDALGESPEINEVVNALIDRAARDPFGASVNHLGVRVIKSQRSPQNGRHLPALRLAYSVGTRQPGTSQHPHEAVVVFLQIRPYDEAADAQDGWLRVRSTLEQ